MGLLTFASFRPDYESVISDRIHLPSFHFQLSHPFSVAGIAVTSSNIVDVFIGITTLVTVIAVSRPLVLFDTSVDFITDHALS